MDNKEWYIYTVKLLSHKIEESLPFATTWIDLQGYCAQ